MSTRRFLRVDSRSASEMFDLPPNSRSSAFSRPRAPRRPRVAGLRTSSTGGASTTNSSSSPSVSVSTKSGSATRRLFPWLKASSRRSTSSVLTVAVLAAPLRGRPGLPVALAGAFAADVAGVSLAVRAVVALAADALDLDSAFAAVDRDAVALVVGFSAAALVAAALVPPLAVVALAAGLAGVALVALAVVAFAFVVVDRVVAVFSAAVFVLPAAVARAVAFALSVVLAAVDLAAGLAVAALAAGLLADFAAALVVVALAAGFTDAFEAVLPAAFATTPPFVAFPADFAAVVVSFSASALAWAPLAFCSALRPARDEAVEVTFFVATDLPLGRTGPAPVARLEFSCPSLAAEPDGRPEPRCTGSGMDRKTPRQNQRGRAARGAARTRLRQSRAVFAYDGQVGVTFHFIKAAAPTP